MKSEVKSVLRSIQHFVLSILFINKGIDNIVLGHHVTGWILVVLGVFIFSYFIYLKLKRSEHFLIEIIIYIFESIALFITAYLYYDSGKKYLPILISIAAVGYLIAGFVHYFKRYKN